MSKEELFARRKAYQEYLKSPQAKLEHYLDDVNLWHLESEAHYHEGRAVNSNNLARYAHEGLSDLEDN